MESFAPILGVGAIVVRDGSLLMVCRGREPAAGLWSVPGGRVEGGESLRAAVVREVAEETGLQIEVGPLAGVLEILGPPHYVVLDFHATVEGETTEPHAGGDAADARWVRLEDIAGLPCTPRFVESLTSWGVLGGGTSPEGVPGPG